MLAVDPGPILRPAGDAQLVFLAQLHHQPVEIGGRRARLGDIAPVEGGAAAGEQRIRPLARGRVDRLGIDGVTRRGEPARQGLGKLDTNAPRQPAAAAARRPHHRPARRSGRRRPRGQAACHIDRGGPTPAPAAGAEPGGGGV